MGLWDGDPEEEAYWIPEEHRATIGGFLFVCAALEAGVIADLRTATGMPDLQARSVIGVPRIADAIASLGRLLSLNGLSPHKAEQFKVWRQRPNYIFAVRNVVAHQSPVWRPDWLRYHSYDTARDISDPEKLLYVCRVDELDRLIRFARQQWISLGDFSRSDLDDLPNWKKACDYFDSHQLPPNPKS